MESSVESSGYFENFSSELDDYDLEEDDFFSSNLSFNGRLVISGEPSVWPVLGTGGKTYKTTRLLIIWAYIGVRRVFTKLVFLKTWSLCRKLSRNSVSVYVYQATCHTTLNYKLPSGSFGELFFSCSCHKLTFLKPSLETKQIRKRALWDQKNVSWLWQNYFFVVLLKNVLDSDHNLWIGVVDRN